MPDGLDENALRADLHEAVAEWSVIDVVGAIDTTNGASLRSPRPWRLLVADSQQAGRGRRSREWSSPPGTSLSLSMTVPLPPEQSRWGWVPLVTGLAVRSALADLQWYADRCPIALKWPNDVLAGDDGGKLCGILCEAVAPLVVVGVGVNVGQGESDLPVETATSLRLLGVNATRESVAAGIARHFAALHHVLCAGGPDDLAGLRTAYREHCATIGSDVVAHLPNEKVHGVAVGVADGGELLLSTVAGERSIAAGDVVHVRRR